MRVVVVGAGIIGLSCAYELVKDGHHVSVIDGGAPGQGATWASVAKVALVESGPVPAPGMFAQGLRWMLDPESPLYVRPSLAPEHVRFLVAMARHCNRRDYRHGLATHLSLAETCLDVLDEWRAEGLTFEEHRRGVLLAFESTKSFRERRSHDDLFARFGYVPEVLGASAVHAKEPALSDRIQHGLYYATDRQLEPESIVTSLGRAVTDRSGQMLVNATVQDFGTRGDRVSAVVTEDITLRCDLLVLAAGAHTGELTRRLGVPLPIHAGKGYMLHYPKMPSTVRWPLTFEDAHVAVSPLDGGLRVGGTMEFGGLDTRVRPRRVHAIRRAVAEGLKDWDDSKQPLPPRSGLRPMTPDGLPVIGWLPGLTNTLVASGHGMLGLTLAPSTAKAVASLARGEAATDLVTALSPDRFRHVRRRALRPLLTTVEEMA